MTPSLELGGRAPDFNLLGVDGKQYSLSSFEGKKVLVILFIANRCPTARVYVGRLRDLQRVYGERGVQLLTVNSDNPYIWSIESYPEMVKIAAARRFIFPYLKDEDQSMAKKYGALVTLHAFVLDQGRVLRYRGRVDDSRDPAMVTSHDLINAIEDVLAERAVRVPETVPFGCSIEII